MDLKVDINPEDVNKMVVDAILKSTLGDAVRDAVKKAVVDISRSYDNPIEIVIKKELGNIICQVLHTEYKQTLQNQVQLALAGKVTDDFVSKIVEKAFWAIYDH